MLNDSKCNKCPAYRLRTEEQIVKIKRWYSLFREQLILIGEVKIILLGESYPANRYFYDLDSNYESGGLMYNLRQEFELVSDEEVIGLFQELGIIVYDCAFCPLHNLDTNVEKRHAATHCMKSYKLDFFVNYNVPIITFFPSKRHFLYRELPEITQRIVAKYKFSSLKGVKQTIEYILKQEKS